MKNGHPNRPPSKPKRNWKHISDAWQEHSEKFIKLFIWLFFHLLEAIVFLILIILMVWLKNVLL